MFFLRENRRHPEFRQGFVEMMGAAPGIAAWGLMTGVAMVKSGMGTLDSLAMALLVFAGSSQLAAIPLFIAGAPMWVILVTAFCVNLRFVVFSAHMRGYLMHLPRWQRLVTGYFTADLTYVLFVRRHPLPAQDDEGRAVQMAYLAGNASINWLSWMLASVLGVALANFIPSAWGLGFAGVLALTGILCSLATSRLRWVAGAVAGAVAVAAYALPLKLNILAAIGVAVFLCMALESRPAFAPKAAP
jgi:predicted branched-subunit amino acid permease